MLAFSFLSFVLCALATPVDRVRVPSGIPSYVVNYAPIVYLYNGDPYRPANIGSQLTYTRPELNFTLIKNGPKPLTLNNLNSLNKVGGNWTYLTSKDDITTNPQWLLGVEPDSGGKTNGAVSSAIIVNDHGNGLVDAFYFYFYAFDYGGTYFGFTVGDHVGDWEHNMIRFKGGQPQALWYSQHTNGQAFTYNTVEKYNGGVRPVTYSANGSHANYGITGSHAYIIPGFDLTFGPVEDHTNKGPVWDPTLNAYYYTYDADTQKFSSYDNSAPVNWLYYSGQWGDKQYPASDPRQSGVLDINGLFKYTDGPTGPKDKYLNRTEVCPDNGDLCIVRSVLTP